jgi:two-component system competent response regulator ComA
MERRIFLRCLHHFGANGVSRVELAKALNLSTTELEKELVERFADNEVETLPNKNLRLPSRLRDLTRYPDLKPLVPPNAGAVIQSEPTVELSTVDRQTLADVAQGLTNKEIAKKRQLEPDGAKSRVDRLLKKLQVDNRTQVLAKALQLGLIQQSDLQKIE